MDKVERIERRLKLHDVRVLISVVEAGKLSWDEVEELGSIVASGITREARAITLFESQGIAIEDVAAAKVVYEQGISEGRGRRIDV